MRLNFSAASDDEIVEGIRRIGKVVNEQISLYGTVTGKTREPTTKRPSRPEPAGRRGDQPPDVLADVVELPRRSGGRVVLRGGEGEAPYRVWCFEITHGGGGPTVRAADEFRIQISNGPQDEIDAVLSRDGEWSGDLVQTCRDGSVITVSVRSVLQRGAHGEPRAIMESVLDNPNFQADYEKLKDMRLNPARHAARNGHEHSEMVAARAVHLADTDPLVRIHAGFVLGTLGEDSLPAIPVLIEMLNHGDDHDRKYRATLVQLSWIF